MGQVGISNELWNSIGEKRPVYKSRFKNEEIKVFPVFDLLRCLARPGFAYHDDDLVVTELRVHRFELASKTHQMGRGAKDIAAQRTNWLLTILKNSSICANTGSFLLASRIFLY